MDSRFSVSDGEQNGRYGSGAARPLRRLRSSSAWGKADSARVTARPRCNQVTPDARRLTPRRRKPIHAELECLPRLIAWIQRTIAA